MMQWNHIPLDAVGAVATALGIGALIREVVKRRVRSVDKEDDDAQKDRRELWEESAKLRDSLDALAVEYKEENTKLRAEIDRIRKDYQAEAHSLYKQIRELQTELHETAQTCHAIVVAKAELEIRLLDYQKKLAESGIIVPSLVKP